MKPSQIDSLRKQGYKIKVTHFRVTQHGTFPKRQIDDENNFARREYLLKKEPKSPFHFDHHTIDPCGGRVEAEIEAPDGYRSVGVAVVGLKTDWKSLPPGKSRFENFNRKIGTGMAFGRAWKAFELLGKQIGMTLPIGTDVVQEGTNYVGRIVGARALGPEITTGASAVLSRMLPRREAEYCVEWKMDPKVLHVVPGNNLRAAVREG